MEFVAHLFKFIKLTLNRLRANTLVYLPGTAIPVIVNSHLIIIMEIGKIIDSMRYKEFMIKKTHVQPMLYLLKHLINTKKILIIIYLINLISSYANS